jgi:hypothetical protein
MEAKTQETLACPRLLQHYLQKQSFGNSTDAPLLMNGLRKCGIYTMKYYLAIKRNDIMLRQMNGTGDNHVKQISQVQKEKGHIFFSYVEDKPKR